MAGTKMGSAVSGKPSINLGAQAGSTFGLKHGSDNGPGDNGKVVGLTNAGGSGVFGGPSVPVSRGDASVKPKGSLDSEHEIGLNEMALKGGSGGADPDEPPNVPVTRSGGSKSKR